MKLQNKLYILILIGIFVFFPNFVNAANCGGTIQCQCGDTLIESQVMWYDLEECQNNGLIIGADDILLDCNTHLINGGDTIYYNGYGIHLNITNTNNFTLNNCNINEFNQGIRLDSSSQNTIYNNNISNTYHAIWLTENSNNNIISNNTLNNNTYTGISLSYGLDNILSNNDLNQNGGGISLVFGQNNQILNNHISETDGGFDIYIYGDSDLDCDNLIENNIGSGDREIKYFNSAVNLEDETISELILCNADNSNINNVIIMGSETLKNNGIIIERTDNSNFTNINSSNNYQGILLDSGSGNIISNSNFNYNEMNGVAIGGYLTESSNNQIINNNIMENSYYDMQYWTYTEEGCNNIIENNVGSGTRPIIYFNSQTTFEDETVSELILCNADNSAIRNIEVIGSDTLENNGVNIIYTDNSEFMNMDSSNNKYGLSIQNSSNNLFSDNILNNNDYQGIYLFYSSNNDIIHNVVKNNNVGMQLGLSSNNNIVNNFVKNNEYSGISLVMESNNNVIMNNDIYNNKYGISTSGNPNQLVINNEIANNSLVDNEEHGIRLWWAKDNIFWGNIFINNGINAQEFYNSINNNSWNLSEQGNYWDDFESNIGYPNYYQIFTYSWGDEGSIDWHPSFVEYYIDDSDEEFYTLFGDWDSRNIENAYNNEAMYNEAGFGDEMAAWKVNDLVYPGTYKVYVWKFEHNYSNLMGTNVHYMVYHRLGTSNWITIDQSTPENEWIYLGEFEFDDSHRQGIMITNDADGYVAADAIKLVYQGPLSNLDSSGPDMFDMKE